MNYFTIKLYRKVNKEFDCASFESHENASAIKVEELQKNRQSTEKKLKLEIQFSNSNEINIFSEHKSNKIQRGNVKAPLLYYYLLR